MSARLACLLVLSFSLAACSGPGGSDPNDDTGEPGFVAASMTASATLEDDARDGNGALWVDGFLTTEVWLDIERVEINGPSGWVTLTEETRFFDLVAEANIATALGHAVLPSGTYQEIRLVLGGDSYLVIDGLVEPLTVPSGTSSGLKLKGPFTVVGGGVLTLALDLDLDDSLHVTGNGQWMMNPVVDIDVVDTGAADFVIGTVPSNSDLTLTLDDGAEVWLPAGSLPNAEVWFVRFPPTPTALSDWYALAPMEASLATGGVIWLPYRSELAFGGTLSVEGDGVVLDSWMDGNFVAADVYDLDAYRVIEEF